MAGRTWQPEEDELIKTHYLTHSSKEIAAMLPGRTKRAIDHRVENLGLQNRNEAHYNRRKDEFDSEISARLGEPLSDYLKRRYVDEQATYRELCRELNINTRTLMRRFKEFGIEPVDYSTAGRRNYEKYKDVYDNSMQLKNSDAARIKNAETRQREWERFASFQAKAIIEELNKHGLFPTPEYAIYRYNIDLAFPSVKLAVEVDGGNWHQTEKHLRIQDQKEKYLTSQGWQILRVKTTFPVIQNVAKISSTLTFLASTHPR